MNTSTVSTLHYSTLTVSQTIKKAFAYKIHKNSSIQNAEKD